MNLISPLRRIVIGGLSAMALLKPSNLLAKEPARLAPKVQNTIDRAIEGSVVLASSDGKEAVIIESDDVVPIDLSKDWLAYVVRQHPEEEHGYDASLIVSQTVQYNFEFDKEAFATGFFYDRLDLRSSFLGARYPADRYQSESEVLQRQNRKMLPLTVQQFSDSFSYNGDIEANQFLWQHFHADITTQDGQINTSDLGISLEIAENLEVLELDNSIVRQVIHHLYVKSRRRFHAPIAIRRRHSDKRKEVAVSIVSSQSGLVQPIRFWLQNG